MTAPVPLRVENLTKVFEPSSIWLGSRGRFTAVDGISFELQPGEILGLLGPNGAGKTTTIHMLLGVTQLTSGTISYFGEDFLLHRSDIMKKVTFASTYIRLLGRLTVYENLAFYAQLYGVDGIERVRRIEYFLKLFGLWRIKDRRAAALSAGEMTRAILAKAFLPHPKVVLLDEPTASLDPDIAHTIRKFVLEQRKEHGVSILFTSHNMDEVTEVCDRVLVLKDGKIIGHDTPESLAASVSKARIQLVTEHRSAIEAFAKEKRLVVIHQEHAIIIEIEEQEVAEFLSELTRRQLGYTQIAIEKPRLEDYFIKIAQRKGDA